jgi:hypothetical protein
LHVETRVKSWPELQAQLYQGSWSPSLERFRSGVVFKGQSDASYELSTRLTKLGGGYATLEPHLLNSFRKYAHRDAVWADTQWNWLAVAQHHGLPTRLLDWTPAW